MRTLSVTDRGASVGLPDDRWVDTPNHLPPIARGTRMKSCLDGLPHQDVFPNRLWDKQPSLSVRCLSPFFFRRSLGVGMRSIYRKMELEEDIDWKSKTGRNEPAFSLRSRRGCYWHWGVCHDYRQVKPPSPSQGPPGRGCRSLPHPTPSPAMSYLLTGMTLACPPKGAILEAR